MKKLMGLGIMMAVLVMMVGCKSYEDRTITTSFAPDGKTVTQTVVNVKKEQSPFHSKSMTAISQAVGLQATFINPDDGSVSPSLKFLKGDNVMGSLPVTSDTDNKFEVFATYKEQFSYNSNVFSFGADVGDVKYSREAGGLGVLAIDPGNKDERIKSIMSNITSLKEIIAKASAADAAQGGK